MSSSEWTWSDAQQDHYRTITQPDGRTEYEWYRRTGYQENSTQPSYLSSQSNYSIPQQYPHYPLPQSLYPIQPSNLTVPGGRRDSLDGRSRDSKNWINPAPGIADIRESLDPSYIQRTDASDFFRVGRVFAVLYTEAAPHDALRQHSHYSNNITVVKFGQRVFTQIRRFIVVHRKVGYCYACPISTYSGRGTLKAGCNPAEHAIIYIKGTQPTRFQGEEGITIEPIAIEPADEYVTLKSSSRVRLGKIYPIEWNLKVKNIGTVAPEDVPKLAKAWVSLLLGDDFPLKLGATFTQLGERRSTLAVDQRSEMASTAVETWASTETYVPERSEICPIFEEIDRSMSHLKMDNQNYEVEFEVSWDVDAFFTEEIEQEPAFAPVLTLSGTMSRAYATTCEDYIRQFWPDLSADVIEQFLPAIEELRRSGFGIAEGNVGNISLIMSILRAPQGSRRLSIKANGAADTLMELAQVLSWVAAAFRRPAAGVLAYSIPTFARKGPTTYVIGVSDLQPVKGEMLCWSTMFPTGVIAKDFPTPQRSNEMGLEIPFDLMTVLSRIWYPMEYMEGLVLKGHSTILVPTQKGEKSVQWHLIQSKNPKEKIGMESIDAHCGYVLETLDLHSLRTARAFVGWCSNAQGHAGTETSGFGQIRDSEVTLKRRWPRLATEFSPSLGTSGLGYFGGQLGLKIVIPKSVFGPVKDDRALLEDQLLNSRDHASLLWDEDTRRGWLISELAAVLMITHVWAARQTDSVALLDKMPFCECSENEGKASYMAIRENRHLKLRSKSDGEPEDLMFLTLVENVFKALQSRKEEIISRADTSISFYSSSTTLAGWEVTDIASSAPFFKEKQITLDKTCGTWAWMFSKRRKDILVLICRGVGDLIQPVPGQKLCSTWASVPKGHCFLTSSVANLAHLKAFCCSANCFHDCPYDGNHCPSRLQEVKHKLPAQTPQVPETGAVIIGKYNGNLGKGCSSPSTTALTIGQSQGIQCAMSTTEAPLNSGVKNMRIS